jgi:acetyltransferase-like isoleucine patch superfamily enzyme
MRKLILLSKRVLNRLGSYANRVRFKFYGVKHGNNCVVQGKLYLKLFPSSVIEIGDNFYFSSGNCINALCANKRGAMYATDGANIVIGDNVGMSSTVLWCHNSIKIGNNVKIGGNCTLIDTDSHSMDYLKRRDFRTDSGKSKPIVIEDDVMIGMNTIVLKGVTIGARSIIGAGSVVTKNIPPDSVACGNPAKVVKILK